jgi:hypothetical protein
MIPVQGKCSLKKRCYCSSQTGQWHRDPQGEVALYIEKMCSKDRRWERWAGGPHRQAEL